MELKSKTERERERLNYKKLRCERAEMSPVCVGRERERQTDTLAKKSG